MASYSSSGPSVELLFGLGLLRETGRVHCKHLPRWSCPRALQGNLTSLDKRSEVDAHL